MICSQKEHLWSGDRVVEYRLKNGLEIYICPKPGFGSKFAIYGTRYGSIDNAFLTPEGNLVEVPPGIAHFLEHKLFESEDGDAFSRYAVTGASANAYTSFDRTCYLFGCSERFDENLEILLDFVRHPYFTPQTVQKEQGIIGQEIRMYEDSPKWVVLVNLLQGVFQNHPVRIDITGTVESIAQITDKLLYDCYNTFYNPANMFVCIAGDVDPKAVAEKIDATVTEAGNAPRRSMPREPAAVLQTEVTRQMPVAQPLFCLGIKDTPDRSQKERLAAELAAEILFGKSSVLYKQLVDQALIGGDFGIEYFAGYGFAALLLEGESKCPQAVRDAVMAALAEAQQNGVDPQLFEGARRRAYGGSIRSLNDVEAIVSALVDYAVAGEVPFSDEALLEELTKADVDAYLATLDISQNCLSVISGEDLECTK